ncbi:MAG: DNA/RNA non-specific endonuclease [Bacteroidetes bacterium]|nr:DNA/RNA non-specific endonuclease [Bacteroidota bacterium]
MTIKNIVLFILFLGFTNGFSQSYELVKCKNDKEIIKHFAYTLSYSEQDEQAYWVAYELKGENIGDGVERADKFVPDPLVKMGSATNSDYKKSGYDRGHLAPAADMKWSSVAMKECFYYSNMSPQVPSFNRGIWKKLEEKVRVWAKEKGVLYIATGPVLSGTMANIGPNKVSVPNYYYKAILFNNGAQSKAIGFYLPNEGVDKSILSFAITIDKLEEMTGLDFFYNLPDNVESSIESKLDLNYWK